MPIARFQLPDGRIARFEVPEGTTPEQAQTMMSAHFSMGNEPSDEELGLTEEFTHGFQRGLKTTGALLTEGVPALAKSVANKTQEALGFEPSFDPSSNLKDYQEKVQEAYELFPTNVQSIKDIDSLGDVGSYIASSAGETLPSLIGSLIGGGVGGVLGKTALKGSIKELMKRGGRELVESELKKSIIRGTTLGATAVGAPQNISESYLNLLEGGKDAPMTALVAGGLKTALDNYTPTTILGKVFGAKEASELVGKSLLKRVGVEGLKAGGFEGLTEASQEAIDVLAENFHGLGDDLLSSDNLFRLADAGLKGAIGGAAIGAISTPFTGTSGDTSQYKPTEQSLQDLQMEEVVLNEPTDDTVLTPSYLDQQAQVATKTLGLDTESLASVTPEQLTELTAQKTQPKKTLDVKKATESTSRQKAIKANKTAQLAFDLGDGIITAGTVVSEKPTIKSPSTKIKVKAPEKLERVTRQKAPKLPAELNQLKPKHKGAELNFPTSYEKALYLASGPIQAPIKKVYADWLKTTHGMTDKQITAGGKQVRSTIDKSYNALGDSAPTVIEVPSYKGFSKVKTQHGLNLPFTGNFHQDFVVPTEISDTVSAVELTEPARNNYKNIIDSAKRIVKEIAGPAVTTEFYDSLYQTSENFFAEPLRGVQFGNVIGIALRHNISPTMVSETAYHEALHFLWDTALTDSEKTILLSKADSLKNYALQDDYLKSADFDNLMLTPEGREELAVNSLAKMLVEYNQDKNNIEKLPGVFRKAFFRFKNFIQRLGNSLRGLGFVSADDIFTSIAEGTKAKDSIDDAVHTSSMARYQKLVEATQEATNKVKDEFEKDIVKEAVDTSNAQNRTTGLGSGFFVSNLRSIVDLASKNPFAALVYDTERRKIKNTSELLKSYVDLQKPFANQTKDMRYRLYEIADEMRRTKQKAKLNAEGKLVFKRVIGNETREITIGNVEASQAYMSLQASYSKVLADSISEFERQASKTFRPYLVPKEHHTLKDFKQALDNIDPTTAKVTHTKLQNFISSLETMYGMGAHDYAPHTRFGGFGIAVKNQNDDTVAFYTVEEGEATLKGTPLYNKFQLDLAKKEIKEKYSGPEYTVYDANGKTSNLENLKPFKMTYNELNNSLNSKYVNLEVLNAMLYSKGVDLAEYKRLRDEVYQDILQKGFEKRFKMSDDVKGYSRDWDRVHHASFSGASHFLANAPYQEEMNQLKVASTQLDDTVIAEKLRNYMDYTSTPQHDWQAIRTLNFMWTMGGNLSTALLQVMTLPFTTLGTITQYNPNLLQNMRTITKWSKLAMPFIMNAKKTIKFKDGTMDLDFGDKTILDTLESKGQITKSQRNFLEKVNAFNAMSGMLTEESIGLSPFETRSLGGSVREKLSNTGRLLGMPVNAMEQMTRFATTMATYETLENNPQAQERLKRILANDHRFQAQLASQPKLSLIENAALFNMDEAHAVFGKLGRVEYQKGIGGALFFPFMTYPHQMLELLSRMYGRGPEGRRALATTIGAMFIFGGLLGLPGAELLKELMEEIYKQFTGVEDDFELMIREKIYDMTGSPTFAKAITQGVGRAYLGMDLSRRVGLPVPGQEILMNVLGIKGDSAGMLGVEGTIITGIGQAWKEYHEGGGALNVVQAMTPVPLGNVIRAITQSQQGVRTRSGIQIVRPEDLSKASILARAFGITTDEVATGREAVWGQQVKQKRFATGIERYRKRAQNIVTELIKAQRSGNTSKAKALREEHKDVMKDFYAFLKKHKIQQDIKSFNKSVMTKAQQRTSGKVDYKSIKKSARRDVQELMKALGVEE